jgi:hypothetical protein
MSTVLLLHLGPLMEESGLKVPSLLLEVGGSMQGDDKLFGHFFCKKRKHVTWDILTVCLPFEGILLIERKHVNYKE